MDVVAAPDRRDWQQDVRGLARGHPGDLTVEFEPLCGLREEPGTPPVLGHIAIGRHREQRTLLAMFGRVLPGRQQAHESIGGSPVCCMSVEQKPIAVAFHAFGELIERAIVELARDLYDTRHRGTISPRRWYCKLVAP